MAETITFDIETLTVGELAQAEIASGLTSRELLSSGSYQLLLGVFVHHLRSSKQPPKWSELASHKVLDVQSLLSLSEPGSQSGK